MCWLCMWARHQYGLVFRGYRLQKSRYIVCSNLVVLSHVCTWHLNHVRTHMSGPCFRFIEIQANIFFKILQDVCVSSTDRRYFGGQVHFETPIKPGVRNSNNSYRYNGKPMDVQFWGVCIYINATKTKNRFWYYRDRNQSGWQKQIVWDTIVDTILTQSHFCTLC